MAVTLSQVRPNVFSSSPQLFSPQSPSFPPQVFTLCSSHPASPQAHKGYWKPSEKRSDENRNFPLEKLSPNTVSTIPRKGFTSCLPVPGCLPRLEIPESLGTRPAPAPSALACHPDVSHRDLSTCPTAQRAVVVVLHPPAAFSRARYTCLLFQLSPYLLANSIPCLPALSSSCCCSPCSSLFHSPFCPGLNCIPMACSLQRSWWVSFLPFPYHPQREHLVQRVALCF